MRGKVLLLRAKQIVFIVDLAKVPLIVNEHHGIFHDWRLICAQRHANNKIDAKFLGQYPKLSDRLSVQILCHLIPGFTAVLHCIPAGQAGLRKDNYLCTLGSRMAD